MTALRLLKLSYLQYEPDFFFLTATLLFYLSVYHCSQVCFCFIETRKTSVVSSRWCCLALLLFHSGETKKRECRWLVDRYRTPLYLGALFLLPHLFYFLHAQALLVWKFVDCFGTDVCADAFDICTILIFFFIRKALKEMKELSILHRARKLIVMLHWFV